jgi:hypothetical protein
MKPARFARWDGCGPTCARGGSHVYRFLPWPETPAEDRMVFDVGEQDFWVLDEVEFERYMDYATAELLAGRQPLTIEAWECPASGR